MKTTINAVPAAWAQRLISELEASDRRAELVAGGLSREQLNWRPGIGTWGIGQCLDHLRAGNEVYLPAIAKSLEKHQPSPVQEVKLSGLIRWFVRNYIGPEVGTRARSPRKARPAAAVESSVLDAFLSVNVAVRELIARASSYDVNRIRFKNPFVPLLRFSAGAGFEIISQHEQRHLLQAERVRQAPGFPGGHAVSGLVETS